MREAVLVIIQTLYFLLPAYLANMTPVFIRRLPFSWILSPLDRGKRLGGKPLFGKNKTWAGLLGGTIIGSFIFLFQDLLYKKEIFRGIALVDYSQISLLLGVLLAGGALLGDLAKSFLKRRAGIAPGKTWFPFDQLDYTIGALVFSAVLFIPPLEVIVISLLMSPVLHMGFNLLGYFLHLQKNKL